ncbi:MAG: PEBP family protein [Devosia sp.]
MAIRENVLAISLLVLAGVSVPAHAQGRQDVNEARLGGSGGTEISAEIWVDNWFALSVNGAPLYEDSTPYHTERSFNGERISFRADLPLTVAFEFRDFMENDTGLEYIGSNRQQMGDGGAIAQFKDATTGKLLGVTNADWRCMVAQHAPVEVSCASQSQPQVGVGACAARTVAAPAGWTAPGFDASGWAHAHVHSAAAVGPKDGYDQIAWDSSAKLIWGEDLKGDNIVLCRAVFGQ